MSAQPLSSSPASLELLLAALIASLIGLGAIVAGAGIGGALPASHHAAITDATEPATVDGGHSRAARDEHRTAVAGPATAPRHSDLPRGTNRAPSSRVAGMGELQRLRAALSFAGSAQPSGPAWAPEPTEQPCPLVPSRLCR